MRSVLGAQINFFHFEFQLLNDIIFVLIILGKNDRIRVD